MWYTADIVCGDTTLLLFINNAGQLIQVVARNPSSFHCIEQLDYQYSVLCDAYVCGPGVCRLTFGELRRQGDS